MSSQIKIAARPFQMRRLGLNTVIAIVTVAACGPIIFAWLYGNTHLFIITYLPLIKDAAFYFLLLCCCFMFLLTLLKISKERFFLIILFIFFVALILCNWLITRAALYNTLYVLRRFITPMLSILVFSGVDINTKELYKSLKRISYVVIIFGLVDYFLLDFSFWNDIIKFSEFSASNIQLKITRVRPVEHTGPFMSTDLLFITGESTRRMVSGFAESTSLASFLVSIHILFSADKKNRMLNVLIIICAFLTISKAAVIDICVILPLIKLFKKLFPQVSYSALYLLWFIGFYFVAFLFVSNGLSMGPFSHISGFYSGVNILLEGKIFGHGIARAGNWADESSLGGGESGCGGMLAQTGVGGLIFIAFFYVLLRFLEKDEKTNRIAVLMIFAWTFIFVFSESSFGISGNFLFWAYPGMALYKTIHRKVLE